MKRFMSIISIAAMIVLAAAIVFPAAYAAERGAKSLFYDPNAAGNVQINPGGQPGEALTRNIGGSSDSASPKDNNFNPGVMYWIELVCPGGGISRVSNDRIFHTGDKVRIHISTNSDGYLRVIHKGSTGAAGIIPVSASPSGEVKIGTDYVVPANGASLVFDNNPGQEKLTLIFASIKSSGEVLDKMKKGQPDVSALVSQYKDSPNRLQHVEAGSKDLIITGGTAAPSAASFNVNGASDFKVDEAVYNAPGNYIVNARGAAKEPVVVEIVLNHQP